MFPYLYSVEEVVELAVLLQRVFEQDPVLVEQFVHHKVHEGHLRKVTHFTLLLSGMKICFQFPFKNVGLSSLLLFNLRGIPVKKHYKSDNIPNQRQRTCGRQ